MWTLHKSSATAETADRGDSGPSSSTKWLSSVVTLTPKNYWIRLDRLCEKP